MTEGKQYDDDIRIILLLFAMSIQDVDDHGFPQVHVLKLIIDISNDNVCIWGNILMRLIETGGKFVSIQENKTLLILSANTSNGILIRLNNGLLILLTSKRKIKKYKKKKTLWKCHYSLIKPSLVMKVKKLKL